MQVLSVIWQIRSAVGNKSTVLLHARDDIFTFCHPELRPYHPERVEGASQLSRYVPSDNRAFIR